MRSSVVFCLAVSFAMFGFGLSLQCYSCPDGSTESCTVTRECEQGKDSCLKLTSEGTTYTECFRYTDCDTMPLSVRYPVPSFKFNCCQSNLCNGKKKSVFQTFKDFFKQ